MWCCGRGEAVGGSGRDDIRGREGAEERKGTIGRESVYIYTSPHYSGAIIRGRVGRRGGERWGKSAQGEERCTLIIQVWLDFNILAKHRVSTHFTTDVVQNFVMDQSHS